MATIYCFDSQAKTMPAIANNYSDKNQIRNRYAGKKAHRPPCAFRKRSLAQTRLASSV
jgi:hypothetical protein